MAPAEGQMGTSRHELAFAGSKKLALWGFGVGCCDLELGTIYPESLPVFTTHHR